MTPRDWTSWETRRLIAEAEGQDMTEVYFCPPEPSRTKGTDPIPSRIQSERELPPGAAIITIAVLANAAFILVGLAFVIGWLF